MPHKLLRPWRPQACFCHVMPASRPWRVRRLASSVTCPDTTVIHPQAKFTCSRCGSQMLRVRRLVASFVLNRS